MSDPGGGSPHMAAAQPFDVRWIHGSPSPRRRTDPPLQVYAYDPDTFVLRQSKDLSYEAPFLYVLFGTERALLLDTGATADPAGFPLRATIDRLVERWSSERSRSDYELVVAHSHSHGDHVAGDGQFVGRPKTVVVGTTPSDVRRFFGLGDDPETIARFDLGGRALEVFAIPGHHPASIAVYDPRTGVLLTGDTVYPGRLYISDPDAFVASLERLVRFARSRPVSYVLGGHVEMTRTPGRDYPIGTRYQPHEAPLPLAPDRLEAVRAAAVACARIPGAHEFPDFALYSGPCTGAVLRQMVRARWANGLRAIRSSREGPARS
jgi:glyoxylase-like metal-dependent hydrolase (beta-lactamase superfamily II)